MLFLYIALIIVFVYLLICFVVFVFIFYTRFKKSQSVYNIPKGKHYDEHKDEMIKLIDEFKDIEYEDIYIKSKDNKTLHARYYKNSDDNIVDICFHGYKGTAVRDFCGGRIIPSITKHNMIIVDERGHGKSKGCYLSMGIREKYDCIDWINYAVNRFGSDCKIMLYGVSMGASTVLFASGMDIKENVKGIIADSPYSNVKDIIKKVCVKDYHIYWSLVAHFIFVGALLFGHFNIYKGNVIEYVKKSKLPILLIHGEDDKFVPLYMSEDIKESSKDNIKLITFKNAGHGISFMEDRDRYIKEVCDFINTCK